MKIELIDDHSKTLIVSIVWIVLSLIWCSVMGIYYRPVYLLPLLAVLLWFPALLLKQYYFGIHLRLGVNEKELYFPTKNKSIRNVPLEDVDQLTFINVQNDDPESLPNKPYLEGILVKLKNQSDAEILTKDEPYWGWFIQGDRNCVYISYHDRENALEILTKMNQFLGKSVGAESVST